MLKLTHETYPKLSFYNVCCRYVLSFLKKLFYEKLLPWRYRGKVRGLSEGEKNSFGEAEAPLNIFHNNWFHQKTHQIWCFCSWKRFDWFWKNMKNAYEKTGDDDMISTVGVTVGRSFCFFIPQKYYVVYKIFLVLIDFCK